MSKLSKRMKAAKQSIKDNGYSLAEGIEYLQSLPKLKFDESFEVALNLNLDVKQADQQVRGSFVLPKGSGKSLRVAVIANESKQKEAKSFGADIVGGAELCEKISEGMLDFDRVIATPDMMMHVGKLGKVLGPKGLMPNPKLGTITMNLEKAIREAKGGAIEYRADKAGVVHALVGKKSFSKTDLLENIKAFVENIINVKPSGAKGVYLKDIFLSTSMSVGLEVDIASILSIKK